VQIFICVWLGGGVICTDVLAFFFLRIRTNYQRQQKSSIHIDWEFLGSRPAQRRARTSCLFPLRTCTLVNPLGSLNLVPRVQRVLAFSQGAVLQAQLQGSALQAQMEYRPSCRIFSKCPIKHPETFQQCGQRVISWHFRLMLLTGSPSKRYRGYRLSYILSLRSTLYDLPVFLSLCLSALYGLLTCGQQVRKLKKMPPSPKEQDYSMKIDYGAQIPTEAAELWERR
jgi:hypothetical protein